MAPLTSTRVLDTVWGLAQERVAYGEWCPGDVAFCSNELLTHELGLHREVVGELVPILAILYTPTHYFRQFRARWCPDARAIALWRVH